MTLSSHQRTSDAPSLCGRNHRQGVYFPHSPPVLRDRTNPPKYCPALTAGRPTQATLPEGIANLPQAILQSRPGLGPMVFKGLDKDCRSLTVGRLILVSEVHNAEVHGLGRENRLLH